MSSRRKSSNPCMVQVHPAQEMDDSPEDTLDTHISNDGTEREESETSESLEKQLEPHQEDREDPDQNPELSDPEQQSDKEEQTVEDSGGEGDSPESDRATQKKHPRGYECKYCPFVTQNLNDFKDHVDSSHPNVILNPLYLCAICNFNTNKFDLLTEHNEGRHPGETNFKFKRTTRNNQTVLEQTIEGRDDNGTAERGDSDATFPPAAGLPALLGGCDPIHKDQITAVNINGTVIIPEHSILQGLSHVTPLLQRPPSFTSGPKIAVPLNTTKYNPSLDDNLTLIASFNKFPYPTHAELSWLTAASKHPEEQIKVWFTTQRLKQGITWSPEEVEEARKKMFNGSIPAAHHTFTILPTSPGSQPSAKTSPQPAHVRTGTGAPPSSAHTLKRPLPPHLTTFFGPETKRPIMAVAPHSGNAKDKVLMAPPPPPPPQKERHVLPDMKRPVAVPLAAVDAKRLPAAVPLLPPSPSSKGKILSALGSPKTKPVVSLPSIVFPESLTRPMIAPPPIFAPPFKNALLIPRGGAKDKSLPTADPNMQNSPPLLSSVARRPPIIQSIPAPAKAPSQVSGFHQLQEQQGVELKASYPRGDKGVSPLSESNGTARFDSKWAHDQLLASHNGLLHLDGGDAMAALKPDFHKSSSVLTQFPLLERMKGKSAKQLKVLEENFLRNSFPTRGDVDQLAISTRLSHQEIESWFAERRALRDNLEQALLNSMGARRAGDKPVQHHTLQLNGVHKAAPPPLLSAPTVPPDGRSLPLLRDDFAPTRWPSSSEEPGQPDTRTGLMRAELARWFTDGRQPSGGAEPTELFHGGPGPAGGGSPPGTPRNCRDGTLTGSKVLEVELGWLMEQRVHGFGGPQHNELREHFAGRLRQQSVAELKNGGQNGGTASDVFGSWLEDGHTRRARSLVLDRDRKMDDVSGRLTG